MSLEQAYRILYTGTLAVLLVLIGIMIRRSITGPKTADRILSVNMIGTMVVCSIAIFSELLQEPYLLDVALIYTMISFISVIILSTTFIPADPRQPEEQDAQELSGRQKRERAGRPAGKKGGRS